MVLLFDIGNTHTHLGLADAERVRKRADILTTDWFDDCAGPRLGKFIGKRNLEGAALCGVVPGATPFARQATERLFRETGNKGKSAEPGSASRRFRFGRAQLEKGSQ